MSFVNRKLLSQGVEDQDYDDKAFLKECASNPRLGGGTIVNKYQSEEPLVNRQRTSSLKRSVHRKASFQDSDTFVPGQWHSREPRSFLQKITSFFVNSYIELLVGYIVAIAMVYPTVMTLTVAVASQVFLIGIPIQIIKNEQVRLKVYDIVVKGMIVLICLCIAFKITLVWNDEPEESLGIYPAQSLIPIQTNESPTETTNSTDNPDQSTTENVTPESRIDFLQSFFYEVSSLFCFIIVFITNRAIKIEVDTTVQLNMMPMTYLSNRHFADNFEYFKYTFIILTLMEVLLMPDLLAIPVVYALLALLVIEVTNYTNRINRLQGPAKDTHYQSQQDSTINTTVILKFLLVYQKVVMMVQVFEFIVVHIPHVREMILLDTKGIEHYLSDALFVLRILGHSEFQSEETVSTQVMGQQMLVTCFIIFFAQVCDKALNLRTKIEMQDEINGQTASQSQFTGRQSIKENVIKKAEKVLDGALKVVKFITFDRRRGHISEYRKGIYAFLPVLLTWLVRFMVAILAYMYNSQIGFCHLSWVMVSFIIPLTWFYTISVYLIFPVICLEFLLVYVSNIQTYEDADIFKDSILHLISFKPQNPFLELTIVYITVVLVGMMIPARLRINHYRSTHKGSSMTKDTLVKNVKDANSSVLWKLVFVVAVRLHTPVLFLMLFMGNQNFNMFQLGFMFFFIAYGASHSLYVRTSIMLPMFVGYFILSQYFWSLVYKDIEGYNKFTDFLYLVDGWEPPEDYNDFYFARMPNLTLWTLFLIMHLLHTINAQFPDTEQNTKYLAECETHIFERIPLIAKYFKLVWDTLFMILLAVMLFWAARVVIQQKSNIINLVYLILFVVTFGKMCSTSLDGSAHKTCIRYAGFIKTYSAVVLFLVVTYHMLRFEFFEVNDWFQEMRDQKSFFVLYLSLFGFSEDESQTKSSVQLYTAYLIVGQILEYHFDIGRQKYEARDLYDWNEAYKSYKGVMRAHQVFQFDIAYIVYRFLPYWRSIDWIATFFHLLTNGVIVYFSVQVSISLFFAIQMSIIVFFYCYTSFKMHTLTAEFSQKHYDMQQATDVCRSYKKLSSDIFLRSRQSLWMLQYVITLTVMFLGYLDDFVDQMHAQSDPSGSLIDTFETMQFYLYWTGCYFPNKLLEGMQPVHFVFLILLCEKQAQNWLFSRWGLNKTMISKFAKLEFLLKLEKKGHDWLDQDTEKAGYCKHSQDVLQGEFAVTVEVKIAQPVDGKLMMEEFSNSLVTVWRQVKMQSQQKRSLSRQLTKTSVDSAVSQDVVEDDHADTMTQNELKDLEAALFETFKLSFELSRRFKEYKVEIEGRDCVLYAKMKDLILEVMYKNNSINMTDIPFLPYSLVKTFRLEVLNTMHSQFLDAASAHRLLHGQDIKDRVAVEKSNQKLTSLRRVLMKVVSRRYSYEMWGGLRMAFEQVSLVLIMLNVIIKCNIASLIYLSLVTNYLLRKSKQRAMRNMVYVVGILFFLQYWIYLFNLTSESSPTEFPQEPYPNQENPYGKYMIPIMYKFEFGRNMKHAYWYSFGVEIYQVKSLWVDFITFAFIAIYLYYYRNPVLSVYCESFTWCQQQKDSPSQKSESSEAEKISFWSKLTQYHDLMTQKYPSESAFGNTVERRLRQLKDACPYYVAVRNSEIVVFTTMHIFTIIVVLLMALCRRSIVSLGYIISLAPCLKTSATVIEQHENYKRQLQEVELIKESLEFQALDERKQKRIIERLKKKYEWSFIKLICVYLSIYSYLDFVTQVFYQVPYVPDLPFLETFGLRKIYPPAQNTFDYESYISGNYQPPQLDVSNLIMQILSCIIVATISSQAELFKSKGYRNFLQMPDEGLDLLMKLAQQKRLAITYAFNNAKMSKILAQQKTEQSIFKCVDKIKINMDMFRKSQQRLLLEEYIRTYGGMYIPPNPEPPMITELMQDAQEQVECLSPMKKMSLALQKEKDRREKLVAEQTIFVKSNVVPIRATFYLFLMGFSNSYVFIRRSRDMTRVLQDMEQGRQDTEGVDLIRIIRADLFAYLKQWEEDNKKMMTEWPVLQLSDLRQTQQFCKWRHVLSRQMASIFRAIVSNTAVLACFFMIVSMYTNAGLISIIYPFAVFGYARLEETRPPKAFWRFTLYYTLFVLLLKYVSNLEFVDDVMADSTMAMLDSYMKSGLHHYTETGELVWHMLPEIMIVALILCHEIVSQSTGLYDRSELDTETVPQAIDRIFKHQKVVSAKESSESDQFGQLERIKPRNTTAARTGKPDQFFEVKNQGMRYSLISRESNKDKSDDDDIFFNMAQRARSETIDVPKLLDESESSYTQSIDENRSFWESAYMGRIFPRVQQQKPGTDYYGYQTFVQVILAYFLLANFNTFSASSPYQEQDFFQTEMVAVLFYMIFVIILERFIARTERREQIERSKRTFEAVKHTIPEETLFLPVDHNEMTVKLFIHNFRFQDLQEKAQMDTLHKIRAEQEVDIALTDSIVTPQQKCKYILHFINMVLVHLYIFWYLPITANTTLYGDAQCGQIYGCKDFELNSALQTFYILYTCYFFVSAKQISQGLPSFRRGSSITIFEGNEKLTGNLIEEEDIGNAMHQMFINIPLAVEIRCLLDFTFTKTALDLWQTCECFQYNSDFFIAKTSNMSYNRKFLGQEPTPFSKVAFGYICTVVMLSFILGPFLMFSNINGMTIYNPVRETQVQFWVQVNLTTTGIEDRGQFQVTDNQQMLQFKLYDNESPSIYDFDEQMFEKYHFQEWPETKFFDSAQIQLVVATPYSDTTWIASDSTRASLQKYACLANIQSFYDREVPVGCENFLNETYVQNVTIGFKLRTLFQRDVSLLTHRLGTSRSTKHSRRLVQDSRCPLGD